MNERSKRWAMAAFAVLFGTVATAGPAAMANLPPEQKQGSVVFLSGGIAGDQQIAIKHAAAKYPLELEFVQGTRAPAEFLSGVQVDIRDSAGRVMLNTTSDGPFLLGKLPSAYSVKATNAGTTRSRTVTVVEGKQQRVLFKWR